VAETAGSAPFTGFGPGALAWFESVERDNSREYWAATKDAWATEVRDPLAALLGELARGWGGEVRLFRQHRDTRFSRDKSPLKTRTYGVASRPGSLAGLYVQVSADGLLAATGYHDPARDQIARYRAAVLDEAGGAELQAAVDAAEATGLELGEPALKGTPRGVPRDHPRADLLRHTSLIVFAWAPEGTMAGRAALDFARAVAAGAAPVTGWLDARVGPSREPPEERSARRRPRR
jgi:uncharacterized protein (TIGR02453 family)